MEIFKIPQTSYAAAFYLSRITLPLQPAGKLAVDKLRRLQYGLRHTCSRGKQPTSAHSKNEARTSCAIGNFTGALPTELHDAEAAWLDSNQRPPVPLVTNDISPCKN